MKFEDLSLIAVKVSNEVEEKEVIKKLMKISGDAFEKVRTDEEIEEIISGIDTKLSEESKEKFIVAIIKEKMFSVDFSLAATGTIDEDDERLVVSASDFLTENKDTFNGKFTVCNTEFTIKNKKVWGKHKDSNLKAVSICSYEDEFSLSTAIEIIGIKMNIKNYKRMLSEF